MFIRKIKFVLLAIISILYSQEAININHNCTDITLIPDTAIISAKEKLHIAYGHTSHGSQLIDGMKKLMEFANNGGKGLNFPENFFKMNNGGNWGAIDLHDYAMGGWLDCGTYPDWLEETELYFDDTINSDVNVVMWSWCGQVADKYKAGKLWSEYLGPMTDLESKYPDIVFVYMTGHVDIADDLYNKAANDSIRSFCLKNGKVLYDFADIERWDPDGYYYEYVNDNCDYYNSNYNKLGNWATEWQGSHVEGIDWFECNSAHSQPLNANQKAYAAWWLFARLGGWVPSMEITNNNDGKSIRIFRLEQNYPNPFNSHTSIDYQLFRKRDVTLEIYNITGEKIVEIVHKEQLPGMYTIDWNSFDVSSGVYVYKLTTNNFSKTKKMLLLK